MIKRFNNFNFHKFITAATGLDPSGFLSTTTTTTTTTGPIQSIDLLGALGINSSWVGVSKIEGPQQLRPAFALQGKTFIIIHLFLLTNFWISHLS